MNRFRPWTDPVCLLAVAAYGLNRWWLSPRVGSHFLHGHFNDLLLVPAALPWVLWMQEKTGLRKGASAPGWGEILLHLVVWSAVCEGVAPRWLGIGVADVWDVLAYGVGGVFSGLCWNRSERPLLAMNPRR